MAHKSDPIATIIVDDESLARLYLKQLLSEHPEIEVVAECSSGAEAIRAIKTLRPKLLFLDIQMPDIDGFDVLENLDQTDMPAVIFVTAHDKFAVRAFQTHALEYILKPYSGKRLADALQYGLGVIQDELRMQSLEEKLRSLVNMLKSQRGERTHHDVIDEAILSSGAGENNYLTRVILKDAGRKQLLAVGEIDWIQSVAPYVEIHANGKTHLVRQKIAWLEDRLDPSMFVRVHRSYIVRISTIKELRSSLAGNCSVLLQNGESLPLSRRRKKNVEQAIGFIGR